MAFRIVSGIYKIENVVNGKCYVGSAANIADRWNGHRRLLRLGIHHSPKLQRAFAKYGEDAFDWLILEGITNKPDLVNREQYWIDTLNSVRDGYNVCPKAGSVLGIKRTPEEILKSSISRTGKKHGPQTLEARAAQSLRQTGKKHKSHRSGWKFSAETRERMAAGQRGIKHSPERVEKWRKKVTGLKHSAEQNAAKTARQTGVIRGPYKPRINTGPIPRRKHTPEQNAKQSERSLGRKLSNEARKKISEGRKRWWAAQKAQTHPQLPLFDTNQ
jgi:group I intron endonuclease